MKELTEAQVAEINALAQKAAQRERLSRKITRVTDAITKNTFKFLTVPVAFIASTPRILDPKKVVRKGITEGVQLGLKPIQTLETKVETKIKQDEEFLTMAKEGKFMEHDFKSLDSVRGGLYKVGVSFKDVQEVLEEKSNVTKELHELEEEDKEVKLTSTDKLRAALS